MPILDEWQRPRPTSRQRRIDLLIGAATVGGALLNVMLMRGTGVFVWGVERGAAEQLLWAFAVTFPLIWRRSHPEIVLVTTAVVFIGGQVRSVQEIQFASGAIFASIYAVGAWGRDRPRAKWLRIAVIGAMFGWLAVAFLITADKMPPGGPPGATGELPPLLSGILNQVLINVLIFAFAYLVGETAWLAAHREHELQSQADALREARAGAEERAVLGERVRIARELHDVVAHHVSVMGIQASAARRAMDRNPDAARAALTAVEQGARTAVDELHLMLGALRAPGDPTPPAPSGIERVADLTDRIRDAGLTAEYAVFGDPVPLPASISQTAYRIVQEAVTNALKHAGASTVDVRIRYLAHELEIDVADDGRGAIALAAAGGGRGLAGMRERVTVHGGTVEAGPRSAGGFRVRARLPLDMAGTELQRS
jgi:signal transduction histidine kinase